MNFSRLFPAFAILLTLASLSFSATLFYQPDTSNFPNPERGYFSAFTPPWPSGMTVDEWEQREQSWTPPLDAAMMMENRANGVTLHAMRYHLAMFRESEISDDFIARLDSDFEQARTLGVKIIVRFAYSWLGCRPDAAKKKIILHLQQLKPVLHLNADVIAFVEAGFVGCWGEWHSSQNDLLSDPWGININIESREILDSLFAAVPQDRMIVFRYPLQKSQYFNPTYKWDHDYNSTPMPQQSEAYNGSNISRAGNQNDSFRSDDMSGTYNSTTRKRVAKENLFTVQGGELDMGLGQTPEKSHCGDAEAEMRDLHWSAFNLSQNLNYSSYGKTWKQEGCFYTVAKNLGYRFRLISADIPDICPAGESLDLSLFIANDGYARIYNPRKVEIILRRQVTGEKHVIDVDNGFGNRMWLPGPSDSTNLTISSLLPHDLAFGPYDVFLNLPDPYESLHDNPDFSIRLANQNVWEPETGYNNLHHTLTIVEATNGVDDFEQKMGSRDFLMRPNYPNPFNSAVTIEYQIAKAGRINIKIYDINGRQVETLVQEDKNVGTHVVRWESAHCPSGVYTYVVRREGDVVGKGKIVKAQ